MPRRSLVPFALSTWLISGVVAAEGAGGPAADEDARLEQAVDLHDRALELYREGRYGEAAELLERALEQDPDGAELAYNLGLVYERLGDLDAAERYYRRYVEMEDDPARKQRGEEILRRIQGAAETRPPSASGPDAPDEVEEPNRMWLVPAGIALVATATGAVFGIGALARDPGATPRTGPDAGVDELRSEADTAHAMAVGADVAFIVAAIAATTSVAVYLTTRDERAVGVHLGPGSGAIRVAF